MVNVATISGVSSADLADMAIKSFMLIEKITLVGSRLTKVAKVPEEGVIYSPTS